MSSVKQANRNVLCLYREPECSYNSFNEDRIILEIVGALLRERGYSVRYQEAHESLGMIDMEDFGLILSMLQDSSNVHRLTSYEKVCRILNSPFASLSCQRREMLLLLSSNGFLCPSWSILELDRFKFSDMNSVFWIKRPDVHRTSDEDVCFVKDKRGFNICKQHFYENGIEQVVIQEHVVGITIKTYAVLSSDFFFFYSGAPPHLAEILRPLAKKIGGIFGLNVYGVDFVVSAESIFVVDVNDWPSFRVCSGLASRAIARISMDSATYQ